MDISNEHAIMTSAGTNTGYGIVNHRGQIIFEGSIKPSNSSYRQNTTDPAPVTTWNNKIEKIIAIIVRCWRTEW